MSGGLGNDTYVVDSTGDVVSETSILGTEIDTVQSSVTWTLGANLETLSLTGVAAINGTGNTLANVLTGNAADNTLNGGVGADTLIGGAGNDTYVVDNVGDVVIENPGEGTDKVNAGISYALTANVDHVVRGVADDHVRKWRSGRRERFMQHRGAERRLYDCCLLGIERLGNQAFTCRGSLRSTDACAVE
jgi:Ca2+-binding RTX toxin-like protein